MCANITAAALGWVLLTIRDWDTKAYEKYVSVIKEKIPTMISSKGAKYLEQLRIMILDSVEEESDNME